MFSNKYNVHNDRNISYVYNMNIKNTLNIAHKLILTKVLKLFFDTKIKNHVLFDTKTPLLDNFVNKNVG